MKSPAIRLRERASETTSSASLHCAGIFALSSRRFSTAMSLHGRDGRIGLEGVGGFSGPRGSIGSIVTPYLRKSAPVHGKMKKNMALDTVDMVVPHLPA